MKPKILLIASSIHQKGNSQLALEYAEKAIKEKGLETDWLILNEYFFPDGTHKDLSYPLKQVKEADGIIWSAPVYFGAWSSLAQEFFEAIDNLYPKVIGMISVGAKRNGGQETTITFAAWDLMGKGACLVNDGYPISQFGGTCVAGPIGALEHDEQGKDMCFSLGKRVAETAMILKAGDLNEPIVFVKWPPKGNFHRCKGCKICPNLEAHERGDDFKCINPQDYMKDVHSKIMEANLIIPYKYDLRFHERTRYLRRDNYRLTYHVAYMPEPRYIPLFIKQNCVLAREKAENYAKLITSGVKKVETETQIYKPIGHENPYLKK